MVSSAIMETLHSQLLHNNHIHHCINPVGDSCYPSGPGASPHCLTQRPHRRGATMKPILARFSGGAHHWTAHDDPVWMHQVANCFTAQPRFALSSWRVLCCTMKHNEMAPLPPSRNIQPDDSHPRPYRAHKANATALQLRAIS